MKKLLAAVAAASVFVSAPASAQGSDSAGLELNHFYMAISVQDIDAMTAFYVDKLGFEVEKDAALGPAIQFRWLTNGSARIELIRMTGSQAGPARGAPPGHLSIRGFSHLGLATSDIEATKAALLAKGVTLAVDITDLPPLGIKAMFVLDPEGNAIEIIQVTGG
jgi:catechol 2,3-dioxygenase-like lactoylglutathione lyase family enzyme